ncbi:Structure-specific endonuclease subunit SLX4 [Paramyrothecium foliicola]|nr:Structure-specific endonuclease subunit SLX4 [Paramyrothecium foliicola]
MASPKAFLSSPVYVVRGASKCNTPSSPDLPPLQDILSQTTHAEPVQHHGFLADDESPLTQSRSAYWHRTESCARDRQTAAPAPANATPQLNHNDRSTSSPSIVEVAVETPHFVSATNRASSNPVDRGSASPSSTNPDKPWRKYKTKASQAEPKDSAYSVNAALGARPSVMLEPKVQQANDRPPETALSSKSIKKGDETTIEPLHLESAMARKLNWTPPTNKTIVDLKSSPDPNGSPSDWQKASVFRSLSETYGCKEAVNSVEEPPKKITYTVVKKRKLIELVPVKSAAESKPAEPAEVSEKPITKRKAPKKKPRTITDLATAAYKMPTQCDNVPPSASLLDYFPADGKTVAPQEDTSSKPKKTRKKMAKVSKKKAPPPKPVLLSPRAALKQVANQDFVFGTSSQLAREQSPTFLRDLQIAMQTSNHHGSEDFVTPINSDAIEPPEQRPKLWDAGARDAEGDLLDLEVINLAENSPELPPLIDESDPFGYRKAEGDGVSMGANTMGSGTVQVNDDSFVNLSDILPSPVLKPAQGDGNDASVRTAAETGNQAHSRALVPGDPMPNASTVKQTSMAESTTEDQPARPKFELYTDAQLSKQIKSYGFKPVKRRTAMIALLDQCWESKFRIGQNQLRQKSTTTSPKASKTKTKTSTVQDDVEEARGSHEAEHSRRLTGVSDLEEQEPPPSAQPPPSPKRPRGRPRKDVSTPTKPARAKAAPKKAAASKRAATATKGKKSATSAPLTKRRSKSPSFVIEIPDSESNDADGFSTSPSSSPEPTFSSPIAVDLSVSVSDDTDLSLAPAATDDQEALFSSVTKAVTTAPRTTDPADPSWYEKILMYDPIVLEDLTAWLNSGQLTRVGFDGEVNPGEVKQWCESKSVCCLWKVNLRGKERKRL